MPLCPDVAKKAVAKDFHLIGDGKPRAPRLLDQKGRQDADGPVKMETKMTSKTLTLLALAGVTAAALSTAAFAQEAPDMQEPGGHGGFAMLNFDSMDADKDGKLTKAEVDASRLAAVTKADSNADGKMSADELTAMHLAMMTERAKTMSANMIERMDSDADGLLSAAEMAAAPGPGKMFDRIDADSDGAITKVEADAAKDAMMARGRDGKGHGRGHGHGMGHGLGMGMDSDNN